MFRIAKLGLAQAPTVHLAGFAALSLSLVLPLAAPAAAKAAPPQSDRVARTEAEVAKAMANPHVQFVRNISRRELDIGTPIVEESGKPIGTIDEIVEATVFVADGTKRYAIPLGQIYAYSNGGEDNHFASRLPKSKLKRAPRR